MLVDSHCHLDRIDLAPYDGAFPAMLAAAAAAGVTRMLCVAIDLDCYPAMRQLIDPFPAIDVSVGVHPNHAPGETVDADALLALASDPRVVAIGETGLDFYRSEGDLDWQRARFRTQIAVARAAGKPLIVHMRDAADETMRILNEEGAHAVGGVLHCFTETWEVARRGLDLGFHISFSGVLTFRSAETLRAVARRVPPDRLLIETDAPYLAPVPHRGKPNEPRLLVQVAEALAAARDLDRAAIAALTTGNYLRLFHPQAAG